MIRKLNNIDHFVMIEIISSFYFIFFLNFEEFIKFLGLFFVSCDFIEHVSDFQPTSAFDVFTHILLVETKT